MHLGWNEIRGRAADFARTWAHAHYEKGETQSFYNAFFDIFGIDRRRVATYEHAVTKLGGGTGFIDLFWAGQLIVEQKSQGRDLFRARTQAEDYLHNLPDTDLPKFVLACDFQTFLLTDLDTRTETSFPLADLPRHVEKFAFILGRQVTRFKDQDPVNIRAAELVGLLHDALERSGYTGHRLEVFLTRIVFCLFADDTGIFEPKDILWDWLERMPDPAAIGPALAQLFDTLNTAEPARQSALSPDLRRFPYVNGHLFAEYFAPPSFDDAMRTALLNACRFDWTPISPAIFGSLFQSVMNPAERRRLGAHYTTERNILKLIGPLFLDDLRAEFAAIRTRKTGRRQALSAFHDRLATLTFFDPACGCGNFLIIAYRELRLLELDLLKEVHADMLSRLKTGVTQLPARSLSRVDVDQFYGIEIEEFPARIAETALWMMDHLMNLALSAAFGGYYPRIPLMKSPTIAHADALDLEWATVLPPERCSYVLGNPPFIGHHLQSPKQKAAMRRTYGTYGDSAGVMDFVTAWFLKAARYIDGTSIEVAFVATNSITQGEQVGLLWRALAPYRLHINFAHRTFKWESEARGKAAVYCVMIGFSRQEREIVRLFDYAHPDAMEKEIPAKKINAYLVDGPWVLLKNQTRNLFGLPEMQYGSKPTDGGHFLLTDEEKGLFLIQEPGANQFIRPFISAKEYLHGEKRWVIWLVGASPAELAKLPKVRERIGAVSAFRKASKAASTRDYPYPTLFRQVIQPETDYILVPIHTSERRQYVPFSLKQQHEIVGNSCLAIPNATIRNFALIQSAMHMAWMRTVCGRLESRYRYSKDIVYNTFPLPPPPTSRNSAPSPNPSLMPAPPMPGRRWPIFMIPTPCPPTCAMRTARWTGRWTGCTGPPVSPRTANGSSISSRCTRRWWPRCWPSRNAPAAPANPPRPAIRCRVVNAPRRAEPCRRPVHAMCIVRASPIATPSPRLTQRPQRLGPVARRHRHSPCVAPESR